MNRVNPTLAILALIGMQNPGAAVAQTVDQLPPELLACAAETDVERRLACFDREMAKLRETPVSESTAEAEAAPAVAAEPEVEAPAAPDSAPAVAVKPAPEPAAPVASEPAAPPASPPPAAAPAAAAATEAPATTESVETAPAPAPEPAPVDNFGLPDQGPDEFTATVTDIARRPYGEMVILLDNGQIWEQKHRDSRFRLDVGEDVTISKGLISGYRLTSGKRNNSIQVERLK